MAVVEAADNLTITGELADVQRRFVDGGWTDGLPIVPPTVEAVRTMIAEAGPLGAEQLGPIPPLGTVASMQQVAANAVMAGCRPEHFRTVVTAVRAMLEAEFNLYTMQTTTHPATPFIVVHGPEARRIGINGKMGALGPGVEANAVIGRAVRLILMNLGGARPGMRDFATLGSPSKYSFCTTENVEQSPWPEFHTTRGLSAETSAVTVIAVDGPTLINDSQSATPARNLDVVASALSSLAANNYFASESASNVVVVLCPEHAAMAADAGWSREAVQRYLYQASMRPVEDLIGGCMWEPRTWSPWLEAWASHPGARIPLVETPDGILIFVAGGPGKFSAAMTTMGNVTHAVTLPMPE